MTEIQREWLGNAERRGGSFVSSFAKTCFAADQDNWQLLLPVLEILMKKYPYYIELKII